jgi:hypothetical protein
MSSIFVGLVQSTLNSLLVKPKKRLVFGTTLLAVHCQKSDDHEGWEDMINRFMQSH